MSASRSLIRSSSSLLHSSSLNTSTLAAPLVASAHSQTAVRQFSVEQRRQRAIIVNLDALQDAVEGTTREQRRAAFWRVAKRGGIILAVITAIGVIPPLFMGPYRDNMGHYKTEKKKK